MKYIVANWKSYKNTKEVQAWFYGFKELYSEHKGIDFSRVTIIVCPSFVHLFPAKQLCDAFRLPIQLGAQTISSWEYGAHTGEVAGDMLTGFIEYVIIGHSERRTQCHEDESMLFDKVKQAHKVRLKTIYCVQGEDTMVPHEVGMVAYEPVWAIGTGKADSPENANAVIDTIKKKSHTGIALYGGSVTAKNIEEFISQPAIDGALIGGASLDSYSFWEMIVNASSV